MNYQNFISYSTVSAVAFTLYLIVGGIYRLYLSPIAKFPGPKLAALTLWYEFYYDVICGGQYTFKIRRMHEEYGPIIRINPYELHIWTPEFYDEIYAGGGKRRDKWDWNARSFGVPESVLGTVEHDKHLIRRAALNPFFSAASVRRLQPMIEERLDKFMKRFEEFMDEGVPMNMSHAFAAYSNDVAMQYAFARSEHRIEAKDFEPSFHYATLVAGQMGHLTKQIPWLLPLMQSLPDWVTVNLYPDMASYVRVQQFAQRQVTNIQNGTSTEHQDVSHPTIFHEIINSKLPPEEKSFTRLWQDGQITVAAGTVTTAWALSVITYHLLKLPDVLRKLKEELATAVPDPSISIPVSTIEQLPYLTACINEGLRLSSGASTRLQRISPREPLHYTAPATASTLAKEYTIPAGTPVSMTNLLLHYNPNTFTSPNTFDPERYIRDPNLTRYLVPFSKGSRHCIGMNLAYAEIYLGLSRIFRVYGSSDVRMEGDKGVLELYETSDVDVEIVADGGIPLVAKESKGIRFKVLKG